MSDGDPRWSRRGLLATGGAAAIGGLAGCTGAFGSDGATEETTAETTTDGMAADGDGTDGMESGTTTDPALGGHPAAEAIAAQPRLGPPPTEAEGVVVSFEDPSCPRCAAFETGTVPKLREQAGDRVSFVFRSYPVIYPWGEPATQAIEAAFAHEMGMAVEMGSEATGTTETDAMDDDSTSTPEDASYGYRQGSEATWALVRHYFEEQDQFDADNVFERTRTFLAEETDLDAETVVADAESGEYDDAVQADLSAGETADVGRTTPTVFLFRDGEFRTSANGSISFEVVSSALGL